MSERPPLHVGDLKPDLQITLDADDADYDLTTATTVHVIGKDATTGAVVFNRVANNVATDTDDDGNTISIVTLEHVAGDTNTARRIKLWVKATWPGTKPQTIPVEDDLWVETAP